LAGDTVEVTFEAVGAEDVLKELDGLVESFASVEKASDVDFSNFVSSLEEGTSAAQEFISTIEELVTGFENLGSGAENATGGISSLSGELQNAAGTSSEYASGTTEAAAASEELAAGISPLASGFGELTAGATEAAGGLTETTAATTETTGALTELSPAFSEVSSGAGEMNATLAEVQSAETEVVSSTQEVGTSFTEMGTSVTEASGTFTELNTATAETATGMVDIATETTNVSTEMTTMGTSVEENASRWQSLDTNIGSTVGFMGQATSGAISLATGFVRLEQAQNRVEKTQLRVSKASEALAKAQEKLNTLRASGTASSGDLAKAELDVQQASEQLRVTQEQLSIQQTNLNLRMTDFYAGIAPNVIQTVTGILAGISQMPAAFNKIGSALGITGGQFQTTSGDVEGYNATLDQSIAANESYGGSLDATDGSLNQFGNDIGTTSGGLTTLTGKMGGALKAFGVAGAIIGVAAVALGLYATNSFGARDAIDAFGEALGNALPPLEAGLVAVQNFAVDVGLAGDAAKAQVDKVETLSQSVERLGQNMQKSGQEMQGSWALGTQSAGHAVEELGNKTETSGSKITTEISGWGAAFSEFGAAFERQDFGKMFDLLVAGFGSIGVVAVEAGQLIIAGFNTVAASVVGFFQNAFLVIGGIVQEGVGRLGAWLAGGVDTHIVQPFGKGVLAVGNVFTSGFATITQTISNAVAEIVTTINGIADQVTNIASQLYTNLGIADFIQMAVGAITAFADQISAIVNAGIAKGREALGLAPVEAPTPRQLPEEQRQPRKLGAVESGAATANTRLLTDATNENTTAVASNAAAQATLVSRFGDNIARGNQLKTSFTGLVGGYNAAEGGINTASNSMANYIKQGVVSEQANKQLAASTAPVIDNFQAAKNIMPGFSDALNAQIAGTAKMTPEMQAYNDALQIAANSNARMSNAVLASKPATVAFGEALSANTGEFEKNFGAAEGYIAAMGATEQITGMSQQGIINYSNALKAGKAELDRVTTGQQAANAAVLGTQAAYTSMTQAQVASAVGYQKEAQALALGNILKADSNRATIALAEAQTQGTQKGVDFANSQFTAQASLTGYRAALSQAIAGNTQYGDSLGLTTKQLEQSLSFQNDVVAAQEAIIDTGAEVVHSQTVQIAAWQQMTQAQLNNLNAVNSAREALIGLNSPLADNAANLQQVNEAFLGGRQAAVDYAMGLRESGAEADGMRRETEELAASQGIFVDATGQTVEQLQRLIDALSGTAEGTRRVQESMLEASSSFLGMLKFDPEVLHTKIDDAFADVPDWIRDSMSHSLQGGIVAQGDIERLGKQFVDNTGAAIVGAFRTADPFKEIGAFATESLNTIFNELDPTVREGMSGVIAAFQELEALEGADVTSASLEKLNLAFVHLQTAAEQARSPFPPLADEMGNVAQITPEMAAGMVQLEGGLANMAKQGASADLTLGQVGKTAAAGEVPIVKLTDSTTGLTTTFANVNGQLVPVNTGLQNMVGPAQLAGNALLGVGTAANAINIRLGDIREGFFGVGQDMVILGQAFLGLGAQMGQGIGTAANTINTRLGDIREGFFGLGTDMVTFEAAWTNMWTVLLPQALVVTANTMGSFITIMGAHTTTLVTYFGTTIPVAFMATQNAMVMFTTMFVANFALLIMQMGLHVTTLNTYFTTTIPMAFMASQNAMVAFTTMFVANFAILIAQIGLHVTTLQTYFQTTIPMVFMASQNAMVAFTSMFAANMATLIAALGAHITTINTYFATTIPTAMTTAQTAVTAATTAMGTAVLTFRNNVNITATAATTAFGKIKSQAATMATGVTGSFNTTGTSALTFRNNIEQVASDFESAMSEMTSHVESFADAFSSAMDTLIQSANDAQQAVEDLQSAIDNLKDKTVTVTVNYKRTGISSFQHGGAFIADRPMNFAGAHMGEHHKPELVTVTPLTNPNKISEKSIDMSRFATATSMQRGGQIIRAPNTNGNTGQELITEIKGLRNDVKNLRMISNTILDGRLIDQTIQKARQRKTEVFT
jgi:hypothetical protein